MGQGDKRVEFRRIIESDLSDAEAVAAIEGLRFHNRWAEFLEKHGGAQALFDLSEAPRIVTRKRR